MWILKKWLSFIMKITSRTDLASLYSEFLFVLTYASDWIFFCLK